jgi:hypothetical protein
MTPTTPYRYEPHEGDGCMWWTVRCDGSPEILNVEAATARLNQQHAEIERLREALQHIIDMRDKFYETQEAEAWLDTSDPHPDIDYTAAANLAIRTLYPQEAAE